MKNSKKLGTRLGAKDLTLDQIREIFRLRDAKYSFREIAKYAKCSASRACEIYKHEVLTKTERRLPWYEKAKIVYEHIRANRGRTRNRTCTIGIDAQDFIAKQIIDKQAPYAISAKLKEQYPGDYRCKESIYTYVYRYRRDLIEHLTRAGKTKRNNRASKNKSRLRQAELEKKRINKRSKAGDSRIEYGHKESDFIVSARAGKSCMLVLVDRKTRNIALRKLPNREADTARRAIFQILNEERKKGLSVKSLTVDNDTAHNHLPMLEDVFNELSVLFCEPYHPWQRGSVEAIIGILRRWWPKGTNFDDISEQEVQYVQNWFNNRPMQVLNGKTPNQAMKLVA